MHPKVKSSIGKKFRLDLTNAPENYGQTSDGLNFAAEMRKHHGKIVVVAEDDGYDDSKPWVSLKGIDWTWHLDWLVPINKKVKLKDLDL